MTKLKVRHNSIVKANSTKCGWYRSLTLTKIQTKMILQAQSNIQISATQKPNNGTCYTNPKNKFQIVTLKKADKPCFRMNKIISKN